MCLSKVNRREENSKGFFIIIGFLFGALKYLARLFSSRIVTGETWMCNWMLPKIQIDEFGLQLPVCPTASLPFSFPSLSAPGLSYFPYASFILVLASVLSAWVTASHIPGLSATVMDRDPLGSPKPSSSKCSPAFPGEGGGLVRELGSKAVLPCLKAPWTCFLNFSNLAGRQRESCALVLGLSSCSLVWRK